MARPPPDLAATGKHRHRRRAESFAYAACPPCVSCHETLLSNDVDSAAISLSLNHTAASQQRDTAERPSLALGLLIVSPEQQPTVSFNVQVEEITQCVYSSIQMMENNMFRVALTTFTAQLSSSPVCQRRLPPLITLSPPLHHHTESPGV